MDMSLFFVDFVDRNISCGIKDKDRHSANSSRETSILSGSGVHTCTHTAGFVFNY